MKFSFFRRREVKNMQAALIFLRQLQSEVGGQQCCLILLNLRVNRRIVNVGKLLMALPVRA